MKFFPFFVHNGRSHQAVGLLLGMLFLLSSSMGYSQMREVHIKAVGGLQFDLVRFQALPGEHLRIILTNTDDMYHNMLFTNPGKRAAVVDAAFQLAERGPDLRFVPQTSDVLWASAVIGPGDSDTLEFQVPEHIGIYPYVCTYPGHGTVMYGAMYVTEDELPPLESDEHIPPQRRNADLSGHTDPAHHSTKPIWHPYDLDPPYWYRIFMPHAGPASIAVNLDDKIAYCWDAGSCRLRYIWTGDFLDISEPWSIKGDAIAQILGEIIYTEQEFPLLLDGGMENVDYKGFQVVEGGFPEFYYTVNGVEVRELIRPLSDQRGISRRFRIGAGAKMITFNSRSSDSIKLSADQGEWTDQELKIRGKKPIEFEIEMKWDGE